MTIRVLRVIARMNVGGPAVQVTTLSDGLRPPAFEHVLLTGAVAAGEADYLELRAPHVARRKIDGLSRSVRGLDDLRALVSIIGEIRRFRPDVVHTHTAKAGVIGRLAAIVCRVPVRVHTFHGHLLHGYFSPRVTKVVVLVERALATRTTALVAVGDRVRLDLLAAGIGRAAQYRVAPPGIALRPSPTRVEARAALELPADVPVITFLGRLTTVKRPDRFLAVAHLVAMARPDAVFLVVGEGDLSEVVRSEAAATGAQVRFLGWRDDVETIHAATDVALLTSDNEGMPVSLIEAAMSGCPAVTTDVGSASEVVLDGRTGFVRAADAGALADAVLALIGDPSLRARFASAGVEHASAAFGAARLVDDMARLYEELAGHG